MVLTVVDDVQVDALVLLHGAWTDAMEVAGLGGELLDGPVVRGAPAFESWLLSERRRLASAAEAVLHEAALGLLARGELDRARGFAVRAAAMSPLDENHQALVIRLYRLTGDDQAAEQQYRAFATLLDDELGLEPRCRGRDGPARAGAHRGRRGHRQRGRGRGRGGRGSHRRGSHRPRHRLPAQRRPARRRDGGGPVAGALPPGAGRGAHPRGARPGRGGPGPPARGRPPRTAGRRPGRGGPGARRARATSTSCAPATTGPSVGSPMPSTLAQASPAVLAKATSYLGSVHSDLGSYPQAVDAARAGGAGGSRGRRPPS